MSRKLDALSVVTVLASSKWGRANHTVALCFVRWHATKPGRCSCNLRATLLLMRAANPPRCRAISSKHLLPHQPSAEIWMDPNISPPLTAVLLYLLDNITVTYITYIYVPSSVGVSYPE